MAIIDEELDALAKERERHKTEQAEAITETPVELEEVKEAVPTEIAFPQSSTMPFEPPKKKTLADRMDEVNEVILAQAAAEDRNFVETIKENVKKAAVTHTEVEREKAELGKKQVLSQEDKVDEERKQTGNRVNVNKWENREKRREFHFNGVRPIMEFVGINKPLNLFFLYFLAILLLPFFLLAKLLRGTIGALVAGAEDANRPKAVKGFLWTILATFTVGILAGLVYLFLKWQAII